MNSKLLTVAIISGLVAGNMALANDTEPGSSGGDQMTAEKNGCKGMDKGETKNSCKGMEGKHKDSCKGKKGKMKKKGGKNSCSGPNGCGEKK